MDAPTNPERGRIVRTTARIILRHLMEADAKVGDDVIIFNTNKLAALCQGAAQDIADTGILDTEETMRHALDALRREERREEGTADHGR